MQWLDKIKQNLHLSERKKEKGEGATNKCWQNILILIFRRYLEKKNLMPNTMQNDEIQDDEILWSADGMILITHYTYIYIKFWNN